MIRRHHLTRTAVALAAALSTSLAPAALADPAPLASAEAQIAANHQSNTAVRPNPDEQAATGATANAGPCSEVCSGGALSYGSASTASTPPPAVVHVVTHNGGFHWGDAGIGAGGMLAVTLIGLGGAITLTHRRRIHDAHAS